MNEQTTIKTDFNDFLNEAQDFVFQMGAVSLSQLQALFPNINCNDLERIITSRLTKSKQCQKHGNWYCPIGRTELANVMTERLIWVALDIMEYEPRMLPVLSRTPANTYMVFKNDKVYELVYLHRNNTASQITMLNEKYNRIHADNPNNAMVYVLVIEEDSMLDELDNYTIHFPHMVAYVSNSFKNFKPEILTTEIVEL